ncbi:MAG: helix-turn-helix domain-containing protein [Emticicia sp.]|uniref:helix-turn-helix domain-containing protein n=1 Tax=Emticicia sp. TaxID=1930953 RepID=UPI003BA7E029
MFFSFSPKSSILLIFFFHGIVFSILSFIKGLQTANKSSLWLGFFTLLCALYIAPFMFGYAGWYSKEIYRNILFYTPFQQLFLLAPVLYFYFKTLLDKSFSFSTKDYIHFLPATLYLIYSIVVFFIDRVVLKEYYFYADGKDKDFSTWYQIIGLLSLTYYLIQSLKTYNEYKAITYNVVSFAESVMFRWAKRFLIAFLMLIAIRIIFFIANPEWDEFGKKFWYYVCFSVLFYYVSISGYTNSVLSTTSFRDSARNFENDSKLNVEDITIDKNTFKAEIADLDIWKEKIESLMLVDKMYENPELVISDLSNRLGTHSKKISQIINEGFGMNFNDFVNDYRTKALIAKIEEGEHNIQTLLGLALDCGFNSKSTFNRAFKRATNLSPKEYIKKNYPK